MATIHPTAIVGSRAVLGEGVTIGAYSIVEDGARIGAGCRIAEHVIIRSRVILGERVQVYPGAVLGEDPQHLKAKGEDADVIVGDDTILREMVTVHRGTEGGINKTTIGKRALIMAYNHIAHDCQVGDGVIMANACQLAGHVTIEPYANLGGATLIPQHLRVGRYSFLGAGSMLRKDVPPFVIGKGSPFEVMGINTVGLERNGFSPPTIRRLRNLYKVFFLGKGTVSQAIERVAAEIGDHDEVRLFLDFVRSSEAGIAR
jgi:UDP-N-acetylglucosamine acyltransferase